MKQFAIKLLASGFFTSYGRGFYPGSRGTIPAWLLAYLFLRGNLSGTIACALGFTILSIYISSEAEKIWGHDAKKIVIDEWAGMFVTLIMVPYSLFNYGLAFVIFRLADAVKIWPANIAEKLPGGWGITADDIVAGIQSCLLTHFVIFVINNYL